MTRCLAPALIGLIATSPFAAAEPAGGPRELSPHDLDRVTAGLNVDAASLAAAIGDFALTDTDTVAAGTRKEGENPVFFQENGVAAGTAVAFGSGDSGATATHVETGGNADGTFVHGDTLNWTIAAGDAQVSGGFTFVTGVNGAFFFGGP
jgi:hypothetical protein